MSGSSAVRLRLIGFAVAALGLAGTAALLIGAADDDRRQPEAPGLGAAPSVAAPAAAPPSQTAPGAEPDPVARGRYLATAGNCYSCHTRPGGRPFAGGLPFLTDFGTLYSTNVTPDPETGIGGWTREQFVDALRRGVRPDGQHLYPAFPYTAYTKLTDEDASALYDYFLSLEPVRYRAPANELRFPFDQRVMLGAWKRLYFREERYAPDATRSAQWNRGAYLVQALGHCSSCHTPRNLLGAEDAERQMTGGIQNHTMEGLTLVWSATNLTSAPQGLAAWTVEDVTDYLKYGKSARAGVFGPMNEVVLNSTRHLELDDVRAMAVYLKSLPPAAQDAGPPPDAETLRAGEVLYSIHCGTCHLPTGLGSDVTAPPLAGSTVVQAARPETLINTVLHGPQLPHTAPSPQWQSRRWQRMEAFGGKLSDEELARLLSYVRNSWGNRAGAVTPAQVEAQR